jgi:hypothetical protein
MHSQNEAGMGQGIRAPNHIQSAGNPFGSVDNAYPRAPQVNDEHA